MNNENNNSYLRYKWDKRKMRNLQNEAETKFYSHISILIMSYHTCIVQY